MPPREALDFRGIMVLFELIAAHDAEDAIQGAIRARERIARHADDPTLARWLDDAALRIDHLKRLAAEHQQDGEAAVAGWIAEAS